MEQVFNIPNDSGPIYQETLMGRFPVEPFNTFSNIFFLIIVIYFSLKVYSDVKNHRFLGWSLPFLFMGFVGGTVYHSTRSHDIWMYMDWLPIVILCFATSLYFIDRINISKQVKAGLAILVFLLVFGNRMLPWPESLQTSMGYIGTALGILFPIFTYMYTTKMRNWIHVFLAIVFFSLAILFRIMDRFVEIFPMGSHWLWHIFGSFSVFFLIMYIFRDKISSLNSAKANFERI